MRRNALVHQRIHSVGHFCLSRWSTSISGPPRRQFRSTRIVHRPPVAAAVHKEESIPVLADRNESPGIDHTVAEAPPIPRLSLGDQPPQAQRMPAGTSQPRSLRPSISRTRITDWECSSCRYSNWIRYLACRSCGAPRPGSVQEPIKPNTPEKIDRPPLEEKDWTTSVASISDWPHVKRSTWTREAVANPYRPDSMGTIDAGRSFVELTNERSASGTSDPEPPHGMPNYRPFGDRITFEDAYLHPQKLRSFEDVDERSRFRHERIDDPSTRELRKGFRRFSLNPAPAELPFKPQADTGPQYIERSSRARSSRGRYTGSSSPFTHGLGRNRERERKRARYISQDADDLEEQSTKRGDVKNRRKKEKAAHKSQAPPTRIILPEYISISNLADVLKIRIDDFTSKMLELGFEESSNDHILDAETAGLVAAEFNFEPVTYHGENEVIQSRPPATDRSLLPSRPPVVTIMGHVDHGKTTLLDWLRNSSVAASEHGGITQHIGAFSVSMPGGRMITFLDTPGHAAFLSMRQRGANVTDIVILVVAADDSVKPQTIEAIKHAQAAKVPIIVAVSKVDKEEANVDRVKQDLARYGIEIEDHGGDTQVIEVSGKTGRGMEQLEEAVLALADILDVRAETDGQVQGWVLEATKKKAGSVATVLVGRGTVRPGDVIVAGSAWAKVRCLRNEAGALIEAAGPGMPVEIEGWRDQPIAGDEVLQAENEQQAKTTVEFRINAAERNQLATDMAAVNETRRHEQERREQERQEQERQKAALSDDVVQDRESKAAAAITQPSIKEVYFIIKADVSGSVEAVVNSVSALGNAEVRPHILRSVVGPVNESDVRYAAAARGHVISFNLPVEPQVARLAESAGVHILDQNIIYRLADDVNAKLSEHLLPTITQKVLGEAEIAQLFDFNVKGRVYKLIAGCKVRTGVVSRNAKTRVLRGQEIIFDGSLSSLKSGKKDATEMRKGNECGLTFDGWTAFQIGDVVQSYDEIREARFF